MASEFGQTIHERRHKLTSKLIEKLLIVKPEDENYALALDFCLQKEYYHSFADVNPRTVESFYLSVIKRLHEDSQLSKASALSALTTKFISYNLTSVSSEINHNLLQLLASLTGQPLDSVLEETPQLLAAVYYPAADAQQQRAAVLRFKQLAADGHDSDTSGYAETAESDYDPFGEESDLTSWESDVDDDTRNRQLPARDAGTANTSLVGAGTASTQQQQAEAATAGGTHSHIEQAPKHVCTAYVPGPALQAPQQLQPGLTVPQPSELLAKLARTHVDHLPLILPDPNYCFTSDYLAQQLLRLLQGHQAQGFVLSANAQIAQHPVDATATPQSAGSGSSMQQQFVADPRVTSPELSPAALHAMLQKFAAAGTEVWQLRKLAQQLTQTRGKEWSPGYNSTASGELAGAAIIAMTPCLRAFGVALQQQLDMMGQQLALLQQGWTVQSARTAGDEAVMHQPTLSLRQVERQTRPIIQRIALLHDTVLGVLQQLGGSPPSVSAALLDGLFERASAAAVSGSGAQGAAQAASLLHLLLCSCVPMVPALEQWLWSADDGRAVNCPDDALTATCSQYHTNQLGQQQQVQHDDISVCCEDFFIVRKSTVAATDARFWHAAYGFSKSHSTTEPAAGAHDMIACPVFLLPLAGGIMTAGKGVRLLDYMEQEYLRQSTFLAARTPSAAWGAAVMRRSDGSMPRAFRPQSSSGRTARFSSVGGVSTRRRWGDTASPRVSSSTAVATRLTREVRLQLAMAAVEAVQPQQQQLPADFMHTISGLLQRSQLLLHEEQDWMAAGALRQQMVKPNSTAEVMRMTLQAVAVQLAQPYCSLDRQGLGAPAQQQTVTLEQRVGLRQALLQANDRRSAQQVTTSNQHHHHPEQQEQQQQTESAGQPYVEQTPEIVQVLQVHDNSDHAAAVDDHRKLVLEKAPAAATAQCVGAAGELSVPARSVPRLLEWRQQIESKLSAMGGCLQQLAPWQQGSPDTTLAAQSAAESLQVLSCCSKVPGSFSGSLAGLWPLQPAAAAPRQHPQQGDCDPGQQCTSGLRWRAGGCWPSEQLSWLLTDPPQQIVSLSELLEQALLQPLQARVDVVGRQLLSSLMGEWGLMQHLQGLVGALLIASPAMVEWTEACFKAVEVVQRRGKAPGGGSSVRGGRPGSACGPGIGSCAAAVPAPGSAAKTEQTAVGPEELDIVELEMLLQDLAAGADVDDPLPNPSCLHLTINTAALADIRARATQHTQQKTQQQTDSTTTPPAASSAAVRGASLTAMATGGLWRCVSEWAGLSCRHSGTWQLSLLYDTQDLHKFSLAFKFLLQLRWVRRRIDAARHAACKGSASAVSMSQLDETERAAVAAAQMASNQSSGRGLWYGSAAGLSCPVNWLSSREELLLLQEMGQLMARWQQHMMDKIIRRDWIILEQALCNASSLDEVRDAAASFLRTVRNVCNAQPSNQGWVYICGMLLKIMDTILDAAAAAAKATELRRQLAQAPEFTIAATTDQAWLELGAARIRLVSAQLLWRHQCDSLIRALKHRSSGAGEGEEAVLESLDLNGYFRTVAHAWTS